MVCIYCQQELSVTNSRPQKKQNQTWRRRLCKGCGAVFTSIESVDLSKAIIVTTEPLDRSKARLASFDRDELFISIYESLRHRPTASRDARGLCDTIVAHIINKAEHGSISRRTIITITLEVLKRFDDAAASYYHAYHKTG